MYLSSRKAICINLFHGFRTNPLENLHTSRFLLEKNYYEILNLQKDCSAKEIRDSFINLAKKHHPDTNQDDPGSHKRFVELQKAYSILSVPSKRNEYDLSLSGFYTNYGSDPIIIRKRRDATMDNSTEYNQKYSEEFKDFYYRSRNPDPGPGPERRVGTLRVVLLLFAFTSVGAAVQYYVIKWLYKRNFREQMQRHERATARFDALKQEMDDRSEEYDVSKLRQAYFQEFGEGLIGLHLVPAMIRPKLPDSPDQPSSNELQDKNPANHG